MTIEADKGLRCLKNIRRRYDALLREFGGKRPTNYARMREFLLELIQIIDQETTDAGLSQSPTLELPNKDEIKKHTPQTIENKGAVVLRTKAEIEAEKTKNSPKEAQKKEVPENIFIDDPSSFKLRDEIEKAEKTKALNDASSIEEMAEKKIEEDPDSKGLSDEELEALET